MSMLLYRSPGDMIHTSPATQKLFQQDFDDYGDSYSEDTTPERLKDVFSKITVVCCNIIVQIRRSNKDNVEMIFHISP